MFQIAEPVTICDQLIGFWSREVKTELLRKSGNVSFEGLVQDFSFTTRLITVKIEIVI